MSGTDRKLESRDGIVRDASEAPRAGPDREIDTAALMNGRRELTIVHAGERYRLRITANDRLILTK